MQLSLTLQGVLVMAVGALLKSAGHDMPDPKIADFVATGMEIIGAIVAYVGRYRHGDITWYGAKK